MKAKFKNIFDQIKLSDGKELAIKSLLIARLSEKQGENDNMKKNINIFKRPRVLLIATLIVLSLGLMGFTFGNQIIELLGGGEHVKSSDHTSMDIGFETEPVRIENNEIYFILDGSNTNITNECSATDYYLYETISDTGIKHIVVVGGTVDNIGYFEYIWDQNGEFLGNTGYYENGESDEHPKWLQSANEELISK